MGKLSEFIDNFWPDTQAVFRRFPLAICMVALFTLAILDLSWWKIFSEDILEGFIGGTVLAAYLAVILTLVGEGRGHHVPNIAKAIVCVVALLVGYFYRQLEFMPPLAIGAAILFLGSAPFWRQKRDDVAVWDFTHKIWTAVVFTVAGSVIYLLGLLAIMAALKSLFGVNIDDLLTDFLLPIGLGFLAPVCWLSMLPAHDEDEGDSLRHPSFISRAVGFLGTWILAPLTLIYSAILIAYGIKIVLAGSLPNGEIAQLVTPYLIIGTLTWLILDPPFIQEKRLARWFHKIWFPLIIPASLLLAVAVFVRIGQYGVTIERYLLVLGFVWAIGIALWFTFMPKDKRDIRIIPGFAALLFAVASIGPWGANQFSAINQQARLTKALKVNNMLDDNGDLRPVEELEITNKEAAIRAKGSLKYLIRQQKPNRIKSFFAKNDSFEIKDDFVSRRWWDDADLMKRFKLHDVKVPNRYRGAYDQYNYNDNSKEFDISGYDQMVVGQYTNLTRDQSYKTEISIGQYNVKTENGILHVLHNEQNLSEFDAYEWLQSQPTLADYKLDLEPRKILYSEGMTEIAIHITNAFISTTDAEGNIDHANMQFMVLGKGVDTPPITPTP